MKTPPLSFLLVVALVCFGFYRRVKRAVSRREVTRGFLVRAVLFAVLSLGLLALLGYDALDGDVLLLAGGVVGVLAGAALGVVGVRTAVFERDEDGALYVTTNRYISLGVLVLVVVRVVYRLFVSYGAMEAASNGATTGSATATPSTFSDPLTLGVLGVLFAYYAVTYVGVVYLDRYADPAAAA